MLGVRLTTTDINFSGSSPSTNGGENGATQITPEQSAKDQAIKRAEDLARKQQETKEASIQRAKELAIERAKSNKPQESETHESLSEKVQAEERPKSQLSTWNPNSKWSGPMRVVQHIGPLRRATEKFVAAGNRYSHIDNMEDKMFSKGLNLSDLPTIGKSGNYIQKLERDKLLINGYSKELSLIDKVEAGELKSSKEYELARKLVDKFLSTKQRDAKLNLKGSREFSLKALSDPENERMYSSLSILYYYCDRND
jgi:hypothetical protein